MSRRKKLKLIRGAEERQNGSVGARLRDLAFQRRSEDWDEVIRLLSILQKRRMNAEPLSGDDNEGIDIAQAFLREVQEPKKPSQSQ
ncbi:MAG: hypothetical protein Q8N58_01995 [bacterium]|nr:hypothetical protein [bacterium]